MDLGLKGQVGAGHRRQQGHRQGVRAGSPRKAPGGDLRARQGARRGGRAELARATGSEVFAVAGDLTQTGDVQRIVDTTPCPLRPDRHPGEQRGRGARRPDPRSDGGRLAEGAPAQVHGLCPLHEGGHPAHAQRQGGGRIVNIVGNDGVKPIGIELSPSAANAADLAVTVALAEQYGRQNILINAINPGPGGHRAVGRAHRRDRPHAARSASTRRRSGPSAASRSAASARRKKSPTWPSSSPRRAPAS